MLLHVDTRASFDQPPRRRETTKHSLGDLKYKLGIVNLRCLPLSQKGIGLMHAQCINSVDLDRLVECEEGGGHASRKLKGLTRSKVKTIGRTQRNKNSH